MMKHLAWSIVSLLCLAGGFFYGSHRERSIATGDSFAARVIDVHDGDTLKVVWMLGTNMVRLVGIDAPEVHDNKKLNDQAKSLGIKPETLLQLGTGAQKTLENFAANKDVTLLFPNGAGSRDSFGRLLAYVSVGKTDCGLYMLSSGMAYGRDERHPYKDQYDALLAKARREKLGVWAWRGK